MNFLSTLNFFSFHRLNLKKKDAKMLKILWTCFFFICVGGLIFYIQGIFVKWIFHPDILTTTKLIPSYQIPLPAITICSPVLSRNDKANLTDLYNLHLNNFFTSQNKGRKTANLCLPTFAHLCDPEWDISFTSKTIYNEFKEPVKKMDECSQQLG